MPRSSWKCDPSGRQTGVISDPVQDSVDVLGGIPFDPSQVGIGECLFDPSTSFETAVVAYVPLRFDGYECCVWNAFCPSCGTTDGLFEFKWGQRSGETPLQGDTDGDFEGNGCDATPLPEPGLGLQFGAGLVGLAVLLRRRGRRRERSLRA